MDSYYPSKKDRNTILELGVDDKKGQIVAKNILAAAKTSLTKKWTTDHSSYVPLTRFMVLLTDTMPLSARFRRNLWVGQRRILKKYTWGLWTLSIFFLIPVTGRWRCLWRWGQKILMILWKTHSLKLQRRWRPSPRSNYFIYIQYFDLAELLLLHSEHM